LLLFTARERAHAGEQDRKALQYVPSLHHTLNKHSTL